MLKSNWTKINQLEKNKINIDNLKKNHKKFIKDKKLIIKSQQRLRSEENNEFTE